MQRLVLALLIGVAAMARCPAEETQAQSFSGTAALTTPVFAVRDKWEVRWDSADAIQITVIAVDGLVVNGAAGSAKGSLYLPKGGQYSLRIARPSAGVNSRWSVTVVELGAGPSLPVASNYAPPETSPAPATNAAPSPVGTLATPAIEFMKGVPPAPSGTLTEDQALAVVLIKGDVGEGTGFLIKGPDGPVVVTNLHVVSANPHVRIFAKNGTEVPILGMKGASDRDLAMIRVEDHHFHYLDADTDVANTVQNGDDVITPGNSEGGEVMLDTLGRVLGIGPERVEFSNPIFHGNSGGPVVQVKSGKVVAVVEGAVRVEPTDDLDKASFASADSAISRSMRYFGLRLDNVPRWEEYDWNQFLTETTFIRNFHDLSRALDSYMNGASYDRARVSTGEEDGPPTADYFRRNAKLQTIYDNFHRMTVDVDDSQKLDATREMVMDLQVVAATDLDAVQIPQNFYSYDQIRVKDEIKYRKYLQKEVETYSDKISGMGH